MTIVSLKFKVQPQDVVDGKVKPGAKLEVVLDAAQNKLVREVVIIRYPDPQVFGGMAVVSANGNPTVVTTSIASEPGFLRALGFGSIADFYAWKRKPDRGFTVLGTPPKPVRDGGGDPPSLA